MEPKIVDDYIVTKSRFAFFTKMFTEIDTPNLNNFRIFVEKQLIKIKTIR